MRSMVETDNSPLAELMQLNKDARFNFKRHFVLGTMLEKADTQSLVL